MHSTSHHQAALCQQIRASCARAHARILDPMPSVMHVAFKQQNTKVLRLPPQGDGVEERHLCTAADLNVVAAATDVAAASRKSGGFAGATCCMAQAQGGHLNVRPLPCTAIHMIICSGSPARTAARPGPTSTSLLNKAKAPQQSPTFPTLPCSFTGAPPALLGHCALVTTFRRPHHAQAPI